MPIEYTGAMPTTRIAANGFQAVSTHIMALLCVFSAWSCASAQRAIFADTVLPEVFRIDAGTCRKFTIGSSRPERQMYYVLADVTSTTVRYSSSMPLAKQMQNLWHRFCQSHSNRNNVTPHTSLLAPHTSTELIILLRSTQTVRTSCNTSLTRCMRSQDPNVLTSQLRNAQSCRIHNRGSYSR